MNDFWMVSSMTFLFSWIWYCMLFCNFTLILIFWLLAYPDYMRSFYFTKLLLIYHCRVWDQSNRFIMSISWKFLWTYLKCAWSIMNLKIIKLLLKLIVLILIRFKSIHHKLLYITWFCLVLTNSSFCVFSRDFLWSM